MFQDLFQGPRVDDMQYMIVHGELLLVSEVEKSLNENTVSRSDIYHMVKLRKCDYCDRVYIWSGRIEDHVDIDCCSKCDNVLCNTMDANVCPGAENSECRECTLKTVYKPKWCENIGTDLTSEFRKLDIDFSRFNVICQSEDLEKNEVAEKA